MTEKPMTQKKNEVFPRELNFLILEDMDNLRKQMVSDLRTLGVSGKIYEAPNVQAAIKFCSTETIDFIISDWNLPDGSGNDFLKKVRAVEKFKKTPFIMCTTNNEISHFMDAVANGANDYMVKPWNIEELKKKIQLTWEMIQSKKLK